MEKSPEACLHRYLEAESLLHHFYTYFDYCTAVCIPRLLSLTPGLPVAACCRDRYHTIYDLDHPSFDLLRSRRHELYGKPENQPENSGVSPCEYHGSTGCRLKDHKSPVCLGFMCRPAIDYLRKKHAIFTYDYLGFHYALEWILTGDMPPADWDIFRKSLETMIRTIKKD
ncbi:hypothetical protein OOT00_03965 [Desulfobotulus sp. H1]|uniref:YkgJ family cysteine cluster protein n=1 Tax=Desulfobotulus pelophilus TaxID=2823377 RepID=A0ABT3N6Q9_9BACT|nr:hypothetical protein [Desulfobotulus pelophilus]MCW7753138.1 hypothetical protein [Desulfobotulus pelophilus]